jgi:ATP-dependent DNA ligase
MLWRSSAPARQPEGFIELCLPPLGHAVPAGPQWVHEITFDGYRLQVQRQGGAGSLLYLFGPWLAALI